MQGFFSEKIVIKIIKIVCKVANLNFRKSERIE